MKYVISVLIFCVVLFFYLHVNHHLHKSNDLEIFTKEPKGELTIVISEKKDDKNTSQVLSESDKSNIEQMINKLSIKEITSFISQNRNISKKEIYNYCLKLKNEN